jgi:hypothetical protein
MPGAAAGIRVIRDFKIVNKSQNFLSLFSFSPVKHGKRSISYQKEVRDEACFARSFCHPLVE